MTTDLLDQSHLADDNSLARQLKRMFDNLDIQILNIIQSNARVSQADVARAVGLAPSAVLERLRKLEAKGVLTGYAALLDPEAIGLGQLAFVAVRTAGPLDVTRSGRRADRRDSGCARSASPGRRGLLPGQAPRARRPAHRAASPADEGHPLRHADAHDDGAGLGEGHAEAAAAWYGRRGRQGGPEEGRGERDDAASETSETTEPNETDRKEQIAS